MTFKIIYNLRNIRNLTGLGEFIEYDQFIMPW